MKKQTKHILRITLAATLLGLAAAPAAQARAVDLLQRYPTTLTAGLLERDQARPWQFTPADIFRVSRFSLEVGQQLKVETGAADLGIGHCADGAVWAALIPAEGGKLTRQGAGAAEEIAHIWLRFHPKEINHLFPPNTVSPASATSVVSQMRTIAGTKIRASFQAGGRAMIPDPKDMTVDVDTKAGPRRFFMVDTQAKTAEYVNAFERQPVRVAAAAPPRATGGALTAPKVIATSPVDGATDVDPGLTEITVTFDQDMGGGFSWTGGGPQFPPSPAGARAHWQDKRTCVMPVKLAPGHHYRVGINAPSYRNFRSEAGEPAELSSINFTTKGATGVEAAPTTPKIIATSPADGATDVDPGIKEITVTFDQDMGGGFSWTGGGPEFPPSPAGARAHWQDKRTCVLPVKLEPGHHYRVGINAPSFHNFRSEAGEPADPSSINFTTK